MNLMNIKLKCGDEIIANVTDEREEEGMRFFLLDNPVQLRSSGGQIYAREWLHFSKTNQVWLPVVDMMYMNTANTTGTDYFDRIVELRRIEDEEEAHKELQFTKEEVEEAREMISAFFQSQTETKH